MSIIDRILFLLQKSGRKMIDLSSFIGVGPSTITNWKQRQSDPPAKHILPICEFFGISVEFLLTGEEKEAASDKKESVESDDHEEVMMLYDSLDKEGKTIVKAVCYQEQRRMNRTE